MVKACVVTGAAGFIGSHLVDRLLSLGYRVAGIDNLILGRSGNLTTALGHPHFSFLQHDVNDYDACLAWVREQSAGGQFQVLWHMAANSDIQAGSANPEVDLHNTFLTTFHSLKLMRTLGIPKLAFPSSSAIYGNLQETLTETTGPLHPISNYGAMKLASEAAVSAALELFLERAWVFRFPNVVGPRATHGVIHDLVKKLLANPAELEVLGDGNQAKPYFHVADLLDAMFFIVDHAHENEKFSDYNIGTDGTSTSVRHIAETVVRHVSPKAVIRYAGGSKGWLGDVPRFEYSIEKLRKLGWSPRLTSDEAVDQAIGEIAGELAAR